MAKGWIIDAISTRARSELTERYAVALSDPEQAVATLGRLLEWPRGVRFVPEAPLPDGIYARLGLTPGMVLRISRTTSPPREPI